MASVAIVLLVVMTAGALAAAGAGATAFGPATFIQGLMATSTAVAAGGAGMTMSSVLASVAIKAVAVGAVGGLASVGLSDGVTAPYQGARSGFEVIAPPAGEGQRSLYDGTIAKFDIPSIVGRGVRAVSQGAFGVACMPSAVSTE